VNGRGTNAFTSAVIAILITLSVVLTASVLFPAISARQIVGIFLACGAVSVLACAWTLVRRRDAARPALESAFGEADRAMWRMPPLAELGAPVVSGARKLGLAALRGYLAVAMILVIIKVVEVAVAGH
jgi:hypothetical protein